MGGAEKIHKHYKSTSKPKPEACDCGGTVMTPEHDFTKEKKGIFVDWDGKHSHNSPREYAVFGWAKTNVAKLSGHHMIFRFTINRRS